MIQWLKDIWGRQVQQRTIPDFSRHYTPTDHNWEHDLSDS